MASTDYKETELWLNAKALLIETYRLTQGWPEDGHDLAKEIRGLARQFVKSVPNAFKKGGITGNVHLRMSRGNLAEFEALCEAAEAPGIVEPTHFQPLHGLLGPIQVEFSALARASSEHAQELMKDRTRLISGGLGVMMTSNRSL